MMDAAQRHRELSDTLRRVRDCATEDGEPRTADGHKVHETGDEAEMIPVTTAARLSRRGYRLHRCVFEAWVAREHKSVSFW